MKLTSLVLFIPLLRFIFPSWVIFFLPKELTLTLLMLQFCCWWILSAFVWLKKCCFFFFSLLVLENVLAIYRILGRYIWKKKLQSLKDVASLFSHYFLKKTKCWPSYLCSIVQNTCLSLVAFKSFSLSLILSSLTMACPGVALFMFLALRVCWTWTCEFIVFIPDFFPFSLKDSSYTYVGLFGVVSWLTDALFVSFPLFFSL